MTMHPFALPRLLPRARRLVLAGCALGALAACDPNGQFDADLRNFGKIGFDTTDAARQATADRPKPDARGIISYPTYQVAVANRGDTVTSVANRIGMDPTELARYNAVQPTASLNKGELLALPRRVTEPASTAPTALGGEKIDITSLASSAIDRAEAGQPKATPTVSAPAAVAAPGPVPTKHKVARGETAYSIARYYNVPVKSLAEWNGLGADLSVREGQYLLIPTAAGTPPKSAETQPGQGSPTPTPPSAAKPLPAETPVKASTPVDKSAAPDLGASRTAASGKSKLQMPVSGAIIRPYVKGKNDGVDIAAAPGTPIKAAEAGTVAAITKNTDQVPILVLRHANGLLTVYANIDALSVAKGDSVKRGQTLAKVRAGEPSFVHFEVRQGYDSVDPVPYLE
ncbi:MAG: M23 family metallopeptidase [Paracoccaceae bacterium]|nr:M23 family metallopeptidase [Paracoccaceae bacterium]